MYHHNKMYAGGKSINVPSSHDKTSSSEDETKVRNTDGLISSCSPRAVYVYAPYRQRS